MDKKKEYNITCTKCGKEFKAKLTISESEQEKLKFYCEKCAWKMIQSGEF